MSKRYQWRAVKDDKTCSACAEMDGREFSGHVPAEMLNACSHDKEVKCRCVLQEVNMIKEK